jgi:hypothetical protein
MSSAPKLCVYSGFASGPRSVVEDRDAAGWLRGSWRLFLRSRPRVNVYRLLCVDGGRTGSPEGKSGAAVAAGSCGRPFSSDGVLLPTGAAIKAGDEEDEAEVDAADTDADADTGTGTGTEREPEQSRTWPTGKAEDCRSSRTSPALTRSLTHRQAQVHRVQAGKLRTSTKPLPHGECKDDSPRGIPAPWPRLPAVCSRSRLVACLTKLTANFKSQRSETHAHYS